VTDAQLLQVLNAQDDGSATDILPGELAVGSYKAAIAVCKQQSPDVAVLNCAGTKLHDLLPLTRKEFDKLRQETPPRLMDLEWQDAEDFCIPWEDVEKALAWMRAQVAHGKSLVVNCAQGKSRSGTMAVAYVMAKEKLPVAEALALVKARRPLIEPNPTFLRALQTFEARLHAQPVPVSHQETRLRAAFRVYDADRSGGLSVKELRVALLKSGVGVNGARSMVEAYAAAGTDELTVEQFVTAWQEAGHGPVVFESELDLW